MVFNCQLWILDCLSPSSSCRRRVSVARATACFYLTTSLGRPRLICGPLSCATACNGSLDSREQVYRFRRLRPWPQSSVVFRATSPKLLWTICPVDSHILLPARPLSKACFDGVDSFLGMMPSWWVLFSSSSLPALPQAIPLNLQSSYACGAKNSDCKECRSSPFCV